MHDDKVYFTEQESRIYFRISNLSPIGLRLDHRKLYTAYYDTTISKRSVRLLEAENVKALLNASKQAHQPIQTKVSEVNADSIFVLIRDTCIVGILEIPMNEHSYQRGDVLNLYYDRYWNGLPVFFESEEQITYALPTKTLKTERKECPRQA